MLDTFCLILRLYTSPENIPVQVKDGCRLLIKTVVFIEHFNVKEILLHGLYNSLKTFSLLYRPNAVHPLCHDAAYESCGALSCVLHTYQHPSVNPPIERDVVYPVGRVTKNVVFLPTEPTIRGGCLLSLRLALLLSVLFFQVRRHSPTLQSFAELSVDHQTLADWSQFCCEAMLNFILICSLQLILMVVGGGSVAKLWK